jgi:hypothetical protein
MTVPNEAGSALSIAESFLSDTPNPLAVELPSNWSQADGTFNSIYCDNIICGGGQGFIALNSNINLGGMNIFAGTGAPQATVPPSGVAFGNPGDFYFRIDGSAALTHIYQKVGGTWTGIV